MYRINEEKAIKSEYLIPEISALLEAGSSVKLKVMGDSMHPFLRHMIDSVLLEMPKELFLKKGDIVMIKRDNGKYAMHRIIKVKTDCFYMVGDAQQGLEGPLYKNQVVAVIKSIYRKEKEISCNNFFYKLLSMIWMLVLPFRYFILKSYKFLRR